MKKKKNQKKSQQPTCGRAIEFYVYAASMTMTTTNNKLTNTILVHMFGMCVMQCVVCVMCVFMRNFIMISLLYFKIIKKTQET